MTELLRRQSNFWRAIVPKSDSRLNEFSHQELNSDMIKEQGYKVLKKQYIVSSPFIEANFKT